MFLIVVKPKKGVYNCDTDKSNAQEEPLDKKAE